MQFQDTERGRRNTQSQSNRYSKREIPIGGYCQYNYITPLGNNKGECNNGNIEKGIS